MLTKIDDFLLDLSAEEDEKVESTQGNWLVLKDGEILPTIEKRKGSVEDIKRGISAKLFLSSAFCPTNIIPLIWLMFFDSYGIKTNIYYRTFFLIISLYDSLEKIPTAYNYMSEGNVYMSLYTLAYFYGQYLSVKYIYKGSGLQFDNQYNRLCI